MPNPNNAPDPQNVYILEDFFQGKDVEEALLKADELNDTKLEFLQAAQDAVDGQQVSKDQIVSIGDDALLGVHLEVCACSEDELASVCYLPRRQFGGYGDQLSYHAGGIAEHSWCGSG